MESEAEADPQVGRTIGHFRVLSVLGRGGMGVVYRAEDERLQRHVALKVLPVELTASADRRRRFLREARTAAALNHPCIAAVHEIGEAEDGTVFIAMELVEGRTVRAMLREGPLPLQDALRIAHAIARGLGRAHELGIVHRDVKPDNVMVNGDGEVKVLDFGLAKLRETGEHTSDEHPTVDRITTGARVLGTLEYMSPEQARGAPVGPESDVFSLGVTLHEMISGERPFSGESPLAVVAAVLRDAPPKLEAVPEEIAELVTRMLAKDPRARPRHAREVAEELARLRGEAKIGTGSDIRSLPPAAPTDVALLPTLDGSATRTQVATASRRPARAWLVIGALAVAASGAAALWWWESVDEAAPRPEAPSVVIATPFAPVRIEPRAITDYGPDHIIHSAMISPDGSKLALTLDGALVIRDVATGTDRTIPLREGPAFDVDWYASGDRVLVSTGRVSPERWQWEVPIAGGEPRRLFQSFRASPSPDGRAFAHVTTGGADCQVRIREPSGEDRLVHPGGCHWGRAVWSHDGSKLAFVEITDTADAPAQLRVIDRRDGSSRVLLRSTRLVLATNTGPIAFLPDGCLAVILAGAGGAEGTTLHRLCPDAPPASEPEILGRIPLRNAHALSFDRRGRAYLLVLESQADVFVAEIDPRGGVGELRRATDSPHEDRDARWLDEDTFVFHSDRFGRFQVLASDLGAFAVRPITRIPEHATHPVPARNGALVYYWRTAGAREGDSTRTALHRIALDGTGDEEVLPPRDTAFFAVGLPSPRQQRAGCAARAEVCAVGEQRAGSYVIRRLDDPAGAELPIRGVVDAFAIAPDGRTFAATREDALVISDFAGREQRTVHRAAGALLQGVDWHPNGRWLYTAVLGADPLFTLVRVAADGSSSEVLHGSDHTWIGAPAVSPGGTRLSVSRKPFDCAVYSFDVPRGSLR